jgi:isoprenylcysteine carboxyl methyltransferase (ICMT) family protein YpbQ
MCPTDPAGKYAPNVPLNLTPLNITNEVIHIPLALKQATTALVSMNTSLYLLYVY